MCPAPTQPSPVRRRFSVSPSSPSRGRLPSTPLMNPTASQILSPSLRITLPARALDPSLERVKKLDSCAARLYECASNWISARRH